MQDTLILVYKTILVPHAGTDAGDKALSHALHIAKFSKSRIVLLHVVEEMPLPSTFALSASERDALVSSIRDVTNTIKEDMGHIMTRKAEKINKDDIRVKTEVRIGDAAQIITNYIKDNKVDLVVMAKRRKLKGVKKLLSLGSVSRKVTEASTIPVLLVDVEKPR